MGRNKVERPKLLARKLKELRLGLGLSQEQMFEKLKETVKCNATLHFGYVTSFENNRHVRLYFFRATSHWHRARG